MAGNKSSKPATVADIQRLVAAASGPKKAKQKRAKAKSDGGGSSGAVVAVGSTLTNRGPKQTAGPGGAVRISNSEFVTDLTFGSGIVGFDLNPVSSSLFTWLARVAVGYELFRFNKVTFVYTPICPSSSTGVVVMAYDYDASDNPPVNKQGMSAYAGSTRGNVWNKLSCGLSVPKGWFYCGNAGSTTINPTGTDIKFYDQAKFYMGLFNTSGSGAAGELSVHYEIDFLKPDYAPPPIVSDGITFSSSFSNPVASPVIKGTIPVTFVGAPGQYTVTFPTAGQYCFETTSSFAASAAPGTYGPFSASILQNDPGSSTSTLLGWSDFVTQIWGSASSNYYAMHYLLLTVQAGTQLTVAAASAVTALNIIKMRISQYSVANG